MESTNAYSFSIVPPLNTFTSSEFKEQIMQYNLDNNLQIVRFRFNGHLSTAPSDYEKLVHDFAESGSLQTSLSCSGSVSYPIDIKATPLSLNVMNMSFFDKLNEAGFHYHTNICFISQLYYYT